MSEVGVTEAVPTAGFEAVARTGDVPPGWVLRVVAGGREIALANRDGELYALDNSCPHAGGPLAHNRLGPNCTLECAWHNSTFDVRTGDVVAGPARKPARTYPVRIQDGTVYVAVGGRPLVPPVERPSEADSDG